MNELAGKPCSSTTAGALGRARLPVEQPLAVHGGVAVMDGSHFLLQSGLAAAGGRFPEVLAYDWLPAASRGSVEACRWRRGGRIPRWVATTGSALARG